MEDLYIDFTVSVLMLGKIVQKIKTVEMEKYGLKPIHATCGYFLVKNPQGLTAKELVDLTLEDKAAISRAIKLMHEKNLVEYDFNSRNALVKLTDHGKEVASGICAMIDKAVAVGSLDFTDEERKFFYKSLGAIFEKLKKYYNELVAGKDKDRE